MEKKLDSNYTKMLWTILNKSWRQHPTKQLLYGHLPSTTKTIKVRRTRHAGHCWRSKDELISDILPWIPSHGRAKAGWPARTYIQQLCGDTGCSLEDLSGAMDDRNGWRERIRNIRAGSATWWWWWCVCGHIYEYIYIYVCVCVCVCIVSTIQVWMLIITCACIQHVCVCIYIYIYIDTDVSYIYIYIYIYSKLADRSRGLLEGYIDVSSTSTSETQNLVFLSRLYYYYHPILCLKILLYCSAFLCWAYSKYFTD